MYGRHLLLILVLVPISIGCGASREADPAPSLPDPLAAGWKGEPVCEKLRDDARLRVLRCTFPPGVGHERHYHAPHFGYAVTSGRMQITDAVGERVVDVPEGSSTNNPGVEWHEVLNVGETTLVYLIVEPR